MARGYKMRMVGAILSIIAVAAGLTGVRQAEAAAATVALTSVESPAGGSGATNLMVAPVPGETVAALTVDIGYDAGKLTPTGCMPEATCNTGYRPGVVRITLANLSGISGQAGSVSFLAGKTTGISDLSLKIVTCGDLMGRRLDCAAQPGRFSNGAGPLQETPFNPPSTGQPATGPDGSGSAVVGNLPTAPNSVPPVNASASESAGDGSSTWVWLLLGGGVGLVLVGGSLAAVKMRGRTG